MKKEERELKISFVSKKEYICPVCDAGFHKEELLSGGGRLIAGALTDELHRLFEPSSRYGDIYPLAYTTVVCPTCWFASTEADFPLFPKASKGLAYSDRAHRKNDTLLAFPGTDFTQPRGLMEGAASLYLALRCYDFYGKDASPTIKRGITSIRGAWLLDELHKKFPDQNYGWLALLFRKKAQYFYSEALSREQNASETMSALKNFGPDIDKNYSYEGMLYLSAYLRFKFGPPTNTLEERKISLEEARRTIAKLFGMGRKSKDKPEAFLDQARKIYNAINAELEEVKAQESE
ncbi:MAG: DUF2225 domain-containing protein [Treponema sp.]|nr:DUF2225 domain-containing protein [Treponema sp.]